MRFKGKLIVQVLMPLMVLTLFWPQNTSAKSVTLPLVINYPILGGLVSKAYFADTGDRVVLSGSEPLRESIVLAAPIFSDRGGRLVMESEIQIQFTDPSAKNRFVSKVWDGYVKILLKPTANVDWRLSFEPLHCTFLDPKRKVVPSSGEGLAAAEALASGFVKDMVVHLKPSVLELMDLLTPLFPDIFLRENVKKPTFKPGNITITPAHVQIEILNPVLGDPLEKSEIEMVVESKSEPGDIVRIWETWDAFLVYLITSLAREPLGKNDQQILFETLMGTRYGFVNDFPAHMENRDFVRAQFVSAWKKISPVFERVLAHHPSQPLLNFLVFFSAAEAIPELDRTLGVGINRQGLVGLASLLRNDARANLVYDYDVNIQLREALGFREMPEVFGKRTRSSPFSVMAFLAPKPAFAAATREKISLVEIRPWIPPKEDVLGYVGKVRHLLSNVSHEAFERCSVDVEYHSLFRQIIISTAWQESCFRQFHLEKGTPTYLRSYNNSSVGLMQINLRIWRGIYDREKLSWSIRYNAMAGCEILIRYLEKAISRRAVGEKPLKNDLLARAVYGMYNAGPAKLNQLVKQFRKGELPLSDRLFFQKFTWTRDGQWQDVHQCLGD